MSDVKSPSLYLCEQWLTPLTNEQREALSPGIQLLVRGMRAGGFVTCDSGDGSNWSEGMSCALPYRHVIVALAPWQELAAEIERARRLLAWLEFEREFEVVAVDPEDDPLDFFMVRDARADEILGAAGCAPEEDPC